MQVVTMASRDSTDPIVKICRSVTVATKHQKQHAEGELDVQTADFSPKHDKTIIIILIEDIMMYGNTNLNLFLEKRDSKLTIKGIMASWCSVRSNNI
jgi:hypothetical protein